MAINRYKLEVIVVKLQKVRVPVGQGVPRVDAIRQIRVTDKLITAEKRRTAEWGFVAQICLRSSFPLPETDLVHGHGAWYAKCCEGG